MDSIPIPEKEARRKRFVVIDENILADSRLSAGDKLVYARVVSFEECYYESAARTAEFLGVAAKTVFRALKKLVSLGLILEVNDEQRGKVYVEAPSEMQTKALFLAQKDGTKCPSGGTKCPNDGTKCPTRIKNRIKENKDIIDSKESITLSSDTEVQKDYGNEDINDALELWEDATGFNYKSNAGERRAIYNLLRRKDVQALGGFKPLVSMVKDASRMDNHFAPQIVRPSELGGKYSKFEKLINWANKKKANEANPKPVQNARQNNAYQPDTAIIGTYYKPHPEVVECEDRYQSPEELEAEKKQRREEAQRARRLFEKLLEEKRNAKKGGN